ncbi:hypothetical protein [Vibrio phage XZ1]|nr:hypothetical protein [Vibrio phage XZ1]
MGLPSTGPISLNDVRIELDRPSGSISLGDADVRDLAERPSGSISLGDLRGKSAFSHTIVRGLLYRFGEPRSSDWGYAKNSTNFENAGSLSPTTIGGRSVTDIAYSEDQISTESFIALSSDLTQSTLRVTTESGTVFIFSHRSPSKRFYELTSGNESQWKSFLSTAVGSSAKINIEYY